MAKTNVSTIATRRDTLAITGAGIIAALGGAVAVSTAKAEAPAINPELARLIAVETEAKAAYEAASAPVPKSARRFPMKNGNVSNKPKRITSTHGQTRKRTCLPSPLSSGAT